MSRLKKAVRKVKKVVAKPVQKVTRSATARKITQSKPIKTITKTKIAKAIKKNPKIALALLSPTAAATALGVGATVATTAKVAATTAAATALPVAATALNIKTKQKIMKAVKSRSSGIPSRSSSADAGNFIQSEGVMQDMYDYAQGHWDKYQQPTEPTQEVVQEEEKENQKKIMLALGAGALGLFFLMKKKGRR